MNNNIYWGLRPQAKGEYININITTGIINYCIASGKNMCGVVYNIPSSIKLSECIKSYSKLEKRIKNTIDKFAKEYPIEFNKCINM